jgi:hypothetical protein
MNCYADINVRRKQDKEHLKIRSYLTYKYCDLDNHVNSTQIRLIELFAGKEDDILRCRIHHVSLDKRPQYEAVSYC